MFTSHLLRAPRGAPIFIGIARWVLLALAFCLIPGVFAAEDVFIRRIAGSDFSTVHEALVEAIEAEGLVVGTVLPVDAMLARTAGDLGRGASPFARAEIVQFCSSVLAWELLDEDVTQIALCPLSITVMTLAAEPGQVVLAYRAPGRASPGRIRAENLLRRLVDRSSDSARFR